MLITRIELENTKSYRKQTVEFAQGTNAICGENGAGKSTLLEAIGFVLFNHPPLRQADFVRQGEHIGCITVHFISSMDAREYQVARRFGKASDYFVYDPELKAKIASGHRDVLDWLKEHLGLEGTADPAVLFRDAIGVPQGLLTAAFLQRPSERKPIFDRLLQVDDFEKVFQDLRETRTYLRDRVAEIRTHVAALEERVKSLPELERQADAVRNRLSQIEVRLEEIKIELGDVVARRGELESLKERLDALVNQIKQLEIQLKMARAQLETAEVELRKSEEAARIVEECRANYEAYQKAKKKLDHQEKRRKKRDELLEEKRDLEGEIKRNQEKLKQREASLQEAEEAAEKMEALWPLVVRQEQLENEIQTWRERLRELRSLQEQLQKLRLDIRQRWRRLEGVKEGLITALRLEGALQRAEQALQDARDEKSDVEKQQVALHAEAERLRKQLAALEATEAATCPVCEQPLSAAHKNELLARNRAQLEENCAHGKVLDQRVAEISRDISQIENRCTDLRSQLRQLPRATERVDLVTQLADLLRERTQLRGRVAGLEDAPQRLQKLEDELKDLGDPRSECHRLAGIAQKREEIAQEIEPTQQEIGGLQKQLAQVETKLLPYACLDETIARLRARMTSLEPNYRRFLENSPLAAMLPERQSQVEHARQELQKLESQLSHVSEERDQVAAEFDPDELERVCRDEERLKSEQSRLEGELEVLRKQLEDIEREIEEIKGAEEELRRVKRKLERLEQTDQVIEFIRNVIRKAGPHMVRLLAANVSAAASKIFRDIMEDPTVRLHWKEDYGVTLEAEGRERDFEQLSGGEQMAAALAVRLALLRELSAVDVAFFDEPTSNLDSTRRENLAEQIATIRNTGLSQLFVISHDDSFEQVTDHVVRVRKEHGESVVETL